MKIEIDTKHDSPEEIRKVIKMLQHLVGENAYTNQPNMFEGETSAESASAFSSMFGDSSSKEGSADKSKEKESEKVPEIIPY